MINIDTSILNEIGLNDKEKEIYLTLLKKDFLSANEISKITKINRTTVYLETQNLIENGYLSYVIKNNKKVFSAKKPDVILEMLEEKKEKLKNLIPQLELLNTPSKKPKVEIYERKEGIKTIYTEILKDKIKQIYIFGSTGYGFDEFKYYYPSYYKKLKNTTFCAKVIANDNSKKAHIKNNETFGKRIEIKYVSKKYYSEVTTVIYGNKVCMQSLKDNHYLIIIEDENLAKSYLNHFKLMWNSLQEKLLRNDFMSNF